MNNKTPFQLPSMTQEIIHDSMIDRESALTCEMKTATPDKTRQNNIQKETNNTLLSSFVAADNQILEMNMDQRNHNDEINRSNHNEDDQRVSETDSLFHHQHNNNIISGEKSSDAIESISVTTEEKGSVSFSTTNKRRKKQKQSKENTKSKNPDQRMDSSRVPNNDGMNEKFAGQENTIPTSQIPSTPYYLRLYTLAREKQQRERERKNVVECDSDFPSKKIPLSRFVEMYERGMIQKKKNGQVLTSLQERSMSLANQETYNTPKKLRSHERSGTPSKKQQRQTPSHKTPESKRSIYYHDQPKSSLQVALEKSEKSARGHKFIEKSTVTDYEVSVFERLYCARRKFNNNEDTACTTFDSEKKETLKQLPFTPDISKSQSIVPSPYSGKNKRAHERLYEHRLSHAAKRHEGKEVLNLKDKKRHTVQPAINHNWNHNDVNNSTNTKSLVDFLFRMPSLESPNGHHQNMFFRENSYGITQPYYGNQPRQHNISDSDSISTPETEQDDHIIAQDPFINNFDDILPPKVDISMVEEVGTGCQLIRVSSDLTLDSENYFE